MKLKPTTFYAMHQDGLVETHGHEFEVNGRTLVVHKARKELQPIDKNYKVSEKTIGFAVKIKDTTRRNEAVRFGMDAVANIDDETWRESINYYAEFRAALKIVGG